MRLNWAQGIHKFFITDDNFARNKEWEAIFDRLIELREKDGIPLGLMIQVDTLCHKIPNFVEKAKRAGVTRVFIGLENINPDNLAAAKKRQNKITEYRKMLLAWKAQGIMTLAGYILGFPADTPETIRRDIAIIQKELPLDVLEFFCLTPLPGSEDHQVLWKKGVAMDPDLNKYDVEHVCTAHPKDEQAGVGGDLSRGLVALLHARAHEDAAASRGGDRRADGQSCQGAVHVRDDGSASKRSIRCRAASSVSSIRPSAGPACRARAPGSSGRASAWETFSKHAIFAGTIGRLLLTADGHHAQPRRADYMDQALTPVGDDDDETLDLLTKTTGARAAVAHIKKIARLIGAPRAA